MNLTDIFFSENSIISSKDLNNFKDILKNKINYISNYIFNNGSIIFGDQPEIIDNVYFVPVINYNLNLIKKINYNNTINFINSGLICRYISSYYDNYINTFFLVLLPLNGNFISNGDEIFFRNEKIGNVDLFNTFFVGSVLHFRNSVYFVNDDFIKFENYIKIINKFNTNSIKSVFIVYDEFENIPDYKFNKDEYGIFYSDYISNNVLKYRKYKVEITDNSQIIHNSIKIGEIIENKYYPLHNDLNSIILKKILSVFGNKVLSDFKLKLINDNLILDNLSYIYNGEYYNYNKFKINLNNYFLEKSKNNYFVNYNNSVIFKINIVNLKIPYDGILVWLFDSNNNKVGCGRILNLDENKIYLYNVILFNKIKVTPNLNFGFTSFVRLSKDVYGIELISVNELLIFTNLNYLNSFTYNNNTFYVTDNIKFTFDNVYKIGTTDGNLLFNVNDYILNNQINNIYLTETFEYIKEIRNIRYPQLKLYSINSDSNGNIILPEYYDDLNDVNVLIYNTSDYKFLEAKESSVNTIILQDSFIQPNTNYLVYIKKENTTINLKKSEYLIFKLMKNSYDEYILPIDDLNKIKFISDDLYKLYFIEGNIDLTYIGELIYFNNDPYYIIVDIINQNGVVVLPLNKRKVNVNDKVKIKGDIFTIFNIFIKRSIDLNGINIINYNDFEKNSFLVFEHLLDLSNYYVIVEYNKELILSNNIFYYDDKKLYINQKTNNLIINGSGTYLDPFILNPINELLLTFINQNIKENIIFQNNYFEIDYLMEFLESIYINLRDGIYLEDKINGINIGNLKKIVENEKKETNNNSEGFLIKLNKIDFSDNYHYNLFLNNFNLKILNSYSENELIINYYNKNSVFENINLSLCNKIFKTDNKFYYYFYGKNFVDEINGIYIPKIFRVSYFNYLPDINELVLDNLGNKYKVLPPDKTFYEYLPYNNNNIVNNYTTSIEYINLYPIEITDFNFENINKIIKYGDNTKFLNVLDTTILKDKNNNVEYFLIPEKDFLIDDLLTNNDFLHYELISYKKCYIYGFYFYCNFYEGLSFYIEVNEQKILLNKNNLDNNKIKVILNEPIYIDVGNKIDIKISPNDSVDLIFAEKVYLDNFNIVNRNNNIDKLIKLDIIEIEFSNSVKNIDIPIYYDKIKTIDYGIIEFLNNKIKIYLNDYDINDLPTTIYLNKIKSNIKIRNIGGAVAINNLTGTDINVNIIPEVTPYGSPLSSTNPGFLLYDGELISFSGVDEINYKLLNCKLINPGTKIISSGDYLEYYLFGDIPGFLVNDKNFNCDKIIKDFNFVILELSTSINFTRNEKFVVNDFEISNKKMFNLYEKENIKQKILISDGIKSEQIESNKNVLNNVYGENINISILNIKDFMNTYNGNLRLFTVKPYKIKSYNNYVKKFFSKKIKNNLLKYKFDYIKNYTKVYIYNVYTKDIINGVNEEDNIFVFDVSSYINREISGYIIVETNSYYSEVKYGRFEE